MNAKVAVKRCADYTDALVYDAILASIDCLGGMSAFVKPGERILIKPNLLASRTVDKAVTTHPSVVSAVIRLVKEAGATPYVGDSPAIGSLRKVAEKSGILEVCNRHKVELVELKELVIVDNPAGYRFKRLEVSKEALSFDGIINCPKFKTHAQVYLTLGVKNLFGCVPGKLKPQWHLSAGVDSIDFADMLLDLYFYLSPRLNIMDAITGMEGNGPSNGVPVHIGLVLASSDAVALDTVAAEIVGARPQELPILKAAARRNVPSTKPDAIDVLGEPIEAVRVKGFKFPPPMSVNFAAGLPYFIDKRLRKALTSRPVVDNKACTLCSICIEVCPPGIMSKTGSIAINYESCIRCYCCQEVCPEGAIRPVQGWLKRLIPGF